MNIVEQNKNQYTKERTDVEKYLMRIVQRFFDIENNHTKESIESIVVESLTRLKRDFYHLKSLVFNLNGETGHIKIDNTTFKAEENFIKGSAFNKDFGDSEDTICEGNDERLTDDREPITHVHKVSDINVLDIMNDTGSIATEAHNHLNQNALNVIKYTGASDTIDLIIIERTLLEIEGYIETLKRDLVLLQSNKNNNLKPLYDLVDRMNADLQAAKLLLKTADNWVDFAKKSIDNKTKRLYNYLNGFLLEKDKSLYETSNRSIYLLTKGEIPITDMNVFTDFNHTCEIFDDLGERSGFHYQASFSVPYSVPTNETLCYIDVSLEYDAIEYYVDDNTSNGVSNISKITRQTSSLPFYSAEKNQHETLLFNYKYDDSNIYFYLNFFVILPFYCQEQCVLSDAIILSTSSEPTLFTLKNNTGGLINLCDVSNLSSNDKAILNASLIANGNYDKYLIDGKYETRYNDNGSLIGTGWFNSNGEKLTTIDWDSGTYKQVPNSYLFLNNNNKIESIYIGLNTVMTDALLSVKINDINKYIGNPKIKYKIYSRR